MRYLWAALILAALGLSYYGMWRGWRRRGRRAPDLAPLASPPASPGAERCRVEGVYLGTSTAGNWLDRVVAQGLGATAEASVHVTKSGVIVDRVGSKPIWIASHKIDRVRLESAQAGEPLPEEGLVLMTWHHEEQGLDTGFAPRHAADRAVLVDAIRRLVKEAA